MNDYKITYTTKAGDSFDYTTTERSEAAARKYFNALNKGLGFTIAEVELIRENTCATKQQEREALETIKKLVEELGPQSYLATAFAGCFEDAEVNIENDFGDSMQARWKDAERRVADAVRETAAAKAELMRAERRIHILEGDVEALRDKVVDSDDLTDIAQLLEDRIVKLAEACSDAANRIVEAATEPESAAFKSAVNDHRIAKGNFEYYTALAQRIQHARGQ